ncbi:MAG: hypothetical protein JWO44_447 [Bacteroidetes bacterium]|nr:hypothetical protein [Bacteroidota bacterium]
MTGICLAFMLILRPANFSYLCRMFLRKYIRSSLLLAFILLSALRGNVYATVCPDAGNRCNDILKAELLVEAKGIIAAAPEICNGGAFQQSIFKLKNSFGGNTSFSSRLKVTTALIALIHIAHFETAKTPRYLFNRSIII